ncbi:MAG TPA: hypothetical protein VNY78_05950 [Edaphobacter sp.]|nr:hypothetical protein [Edaphobacter sp.]
MATRGVMPLGADQANVLQSPSVASDGQDMSFAKSFGEVADGAVGTTLAGQMLKRNAAPIATEADAPVASMEKLLNVSAGEGAKATSTPATTVLAKNDDAGVVIAPAVSAQSSLKPENVSQGVFVVDESTAIGNASQQSAGIDVSVRTSPVSIEKPTGAIEDATGNQEAAGTKIDSVMLPIASKVVQPILAGAADQPVVQKKEVAAASTGKPIAEKAAKKDLKNSSVAGANSTNVSTPVEVVGTQVAMTVSAGSAPLVVAKAQTIDTAEGDSNVAAASGQMVGIAGVKAVKSSSYGADRGIVGTSASGVSNNGTVAAAKADDGIAGTKKDASDSSKTAASTASANGLSEGTTHGSGGVVAVSAAHGVVAATGNVAGDAVAVKASANGNSVALATGDRASQSASSVSEGHRTLEATSTSLEVGVANGTHGWLKIRAEMTDGGVVNASVTATTSAGQEMLHRELPSLTAYLQQEQIGVGSVVLHTTAAAGSQEFAGGMERDAGRELMQQSDGREGESQQDASGTTFSDSGEAYVQGGLSGMAEITTNTVYAGGSWLSVRA